MKKSGAVRIGAKIRFRQISDNREQIPSPLGETAPDISTSIIHAQQPLSLLADVQAAISLPWIFEPSRTDSSEA